MNDLFKKGYKYLILLTILLLTLPLVIFAQSALTFSASPLYSMPLGTSAEIYQYGFGGDFEVKTPFALQQSIINLYVTVKNTGNGILWE